MSTSLYKLKALREVFDHSQPLNDLPQEVKEVMAPTSPIMAQFLYPVFGSNSFPITYHTNIRSEAEVKRLLSKILDARNSLTKEACEFWNQALNRFVGTPIPQNLEGVCIKTMSSSNNSVKAVCRATPDKWSCSGCGKTWVPGSYMSASCKSHPDPFWKDALQPDLDALIKEHGVSKEAPLVWADGQASRLFKKASKAPRATK